MKSLFNISVIRFLAPVSALTIRLQLPRKLNRGTCQEIIATQRTASRARQKAILSAQMNSLRVVDILPGDAMIRSSIHV
ncbi:hypothetical protein CY34DRAFT_162408 [Suillus luteus UH-Slu-Lm8-n1]|uniref:Secreted protein n=1 Tax=Suillus luteus UH-Slu-Lm8-n1 TaxID=930992 RepID=A0A0D0AJR3_9AGAM|nr:hypothetical protein CY34DRAFT_162408 [Suillus luteus UH-Slu-Lm8-n1]